VITFGANAHSVPLAASGAAVAGLLVLALGIAVHRPLPPCPRTPESTSSADALDVRRVLDGRGSRRLCPHRRSLGLPGGDAALLVLLVAWFVVSQVLIRTLRAGRLSPETAAA